LEDRSLAAAAANGDQAAFTTLVERYRGYVYTIAYRIALNEDDALDVAQTVFLRLVERIGDFTGRGSFRGWIATIAAREAISHCRRSQRREQPTDPDTLERLREGNSHGGGGANCAVVAPTQRQAILHNERRARVEAAMARLPPQQRAIFALRFQENMASAEIAERLDLPATQVRAQLCRAVARLRELVGED